MKKFTNLAVLLLFTFQFAFFTSYSQSPKKFKYQTVVRNSIGAIVHNQPVAFKISILQGNATGTVSYCETQSKTTNDFGLVNLEIGNGTLVTGTINAINWANGPYFVKVELDITNGSNFITMGTSELLSVPYALYAEKAGTTTYTETDPIFAGHIAYGINASNITNWNAAFGWGNHTGLYRPISWVPAWIDINSKPTTLAGYGITDAFNGTWASLTGKPALWDSSWATIKNKPAFATVATSGNYNDLSNKPTLFSGNFADLTNLPTTLAGHGITNAMSTSHVANAITATNITNWTTAFGWGNHAGLYRPITYVPAWSEVTSKPSFATVATTGSYNDLSNKPALFSGSFADISNKPTTLAGYGISDAMSILHAANSVSATSITNWNAAFGWGNHAGLYRPISYVPTWNDVTSKPSFATVATSGNYNDLSNKPSFNGSWASITGTPTTLAGYGITNAMSTSHAANAITATNITNWNTAFGWGNHAGLYRPITYVPAWSEITSKPNFATVATTGSYNDLTNKPAPYVAGTGIQFTGSTISANLNLSVSSSGDTLWLNPGNFVIVPSISSVNATSPIVSNTTITNITQTTANMGYTIALYGAPTITTRGVCWDTLINPTIASYKTTETGGTGTFTSSMTGLQFNKIYYTRAYAINANGIYYSSVRTFSTLPSTATITTFDTANVTQTTAISGGVITDNGGANVTERGVCWATSQNPTINNNRTSNGIGLGSFTSNLTNLQPNTSYYYRAYATNSAGTSYGDQKSFITKFVLPDIITDTVVSINQISATVNSYIISQGSSSVSERGICWNYNPNPTIYNNKINSGSGIGNFSTTMSNLRPNTTYYVRAYATNSFGTIYGANKSFTTTNAYYEGFENGYPTIWSGIGWGISNTNTPYEGYNCLRSNQNNDSIQFTKTVTTSPNGNISFYYKGNSDSWCGHSTSFYIDNVLQATFSDGQWALHSYSVPSGVHTFKWKVIDNCGHLGGVNIDYIIVSP